MESKKLSYLLTLVFSLLLLEASMASRILPKYRRSVEFAGGVNGSIAHKDGISVLVPAPWEEPWATTSQAGQPNTSTSAVVTTPSNAKVNVSTAISPAGATLDKQRH